MKRVVITGGTGFIGSALVKKMINKNIKVTLLTRNRKYVKEEISNDIEIIEYNPMKASQVCLKDKYDCFYHLAWGGVSAIEKNCLNTQLENIKCSIEAINLAREICCSKFVMAGTVAEYVFSEKVINIEEKQTPSDYYGAAKVSAHYFLDVESKKLKIPMNWVLIPSTYGEHREGENIITYTIEKLLSKSKTYYGDLQQMWDFLYVEDTANALYLIGEKGIEGKSYGVGSGVYKTLRWYIECIRDCIDPSAELGIGLLPNMTSKAFSSCVNIGDLQKDTGFKPNFTFEQGINKTIEWYKKIY